ncbi:MAG: methylmalonyl-CoA mutase family protein, partial [Myxococcota bacterium]
ENEFDLLEVDNRAVRDAQLSRLGALRAERDAGAVGAALETLESLARTGEGNLFEAAVDAARARASVGEISDALEKVYGRHRPETRTISGVYASAFQGDAEYDAVCREVEEFARSEGRRPRILVCKLGQDGHDRGMKVIATAFADLGFDVDIGPLFQMPEEAARQAVENDVHAVGVSTQAGGHKTLIPQLAAALAAQGARDVVVVAGGIIPPQDHAGLREEGCAAIFGPGTPIPKAAREVLQAIRARRA